MMKFLSVLIALCFLAGPAHAQALQKFQKVTDPTAAQLPIEPSFPPITFQDLEPPTSLKDRIDALLYGITVDIPPEYDRYGYKIRQHMAAIAGPAVLKNPENVRAQIKNVEIAQATLEEWNDVLIKEFQTLETRAETENASARTRTLLRYNKGKAQAFIAECRSWIINNKDMLKVLDEAATRYKFKGTDFKFQTNKDLRTFAAHYEARKQALAIIRKYDSFRNMVY